MNQRRGLQGLPRRLERHFMRRQFAQFIVHEREQLVGSLGIASRNRSENLREFTHAAAGYNALVT